MSVGRFLALDARHTSTIGLVGWRRYGLKVRVAALSERVDLIPVNTYDGLTAERRVIVRAHLAAMYAMIYWIFKSLVAD